jgi:hypothetical protein
MFRVGREDGVKVFLRNDLLGFLGVFLGFLAIAVAVTLLLAIAVAVTLLLVL